MSEGPEWRRVRRMLVGLGCGVLLYALVGVLREAAVTTPAMTAVRWIGILMAHDLVLVPLVIVVGVLVGRLPRSVAPAVPWIGPGPHE